MRNSLSFIQKISKIGRILSKIAFVFSLIGAIGCLVGVVCLIVGVGAMQLGGLSIQGFIQREAGMSLSATCITMGFSAVICACQVVLAKLAEQYFTHELAAGTPFTFEGAVEMRNLGIVNIVVGICTAVFFGIVVAVSSLMKIDIADKIQIETGSGIGLGITMLLLSLIFCYGAEVRTQKTEEICEPLEKV